MLFGLRSIKAIRGIGPFLESARAWVMTREQESVIIGSGIFVLRDGRNRRQSSFLGNVIERRLLG